MKPLVACLLMITLITDKALSANHLASADRILFVVSNAHYYGDSKISAANHFAEIVLAYDVLVNAGYNIDFVSPKGGAIPIGYIDTSIPLIKRYLYDGAFMDLLEHTLEPREVDPANYCAAYYGGGGSAMFGVPEDEQIQAIVMSIYEDQKGVVSAICHGSAGIVHLKTHDGQYLVSGKRVNGFPDMFENTEAEYYQQFPFSIERQVIQHGGKFEYSKDGWDEYTVVDGRLITGQDPSAAATLAQHLIDLLQKKS